MSDGSITIEFIGEGRTDRGPTLGAKEDDDSGVVVILTKKLCGSPANLKVKRQPIPFLQRKGLWQKVKLAKERAFYSGSAGLVFVTDTEGKHPAQLNELKRGRDSRFLDFPMAVGVAHPCIETWLLADPSAIRRALTLPADPILPSTPETLPAPCQNRDNNPKVILAGCEKSRRFLSSRQNSAIAEAIRDLEVIETHCPIGFAPFAEEVRTQLRPLFEREVS
jgi:hypothetical protein